MDLGLFGAVGGLDSEEPAEEVVGDLDLGEALGELALEAEDLPDQSVGPGEGGVDLRSNSDEASGHSVLEVVLLGVERHDSGVYGRALDGAVVGLGDDSGAQLDFVSDLEDSL